MIFKIIRAFRTWQTLRIGWWRSPLPLPSHSATMSAEAADTTPDDILGLGMSTPSPPVGKNRHATPINDSSFLSAGSATPQSDAVGYGRADLPLTLSSFLRQHKASPVDTLLDCLRLQFVDALYAVPCCCLALPPVRDGSAEGREERMSPSCSLWEEKSEGGLRFARLP